MSWIDDYRSHGAWSTLRIAQANFDRAASDGAFPNDDVRVEMLRALLGRLKGLQESPDITITQSSLDELAGHLDLLSNFIPDLDVLYSGSRGPQIVEQISRLVSGWPQPGPVRSKGIIRQLASIEAEIAAVRARFPEIDEKLESAKSEMRSYVDVQKNDLGVAAQAFASRVAEFEREVRALGSAAETQKGRIDTAIANFQAEFNSHEAERREEWAELLESQNEDAKLHLENMISHEHRSRKVLEAVGVNSTATDFGQYALEQSKAANRWRVVASWVFVFAGIWFIASSLPWLVPNGADLWESALARLGVTAAVAGVGAYAARESSQHRREERKAKQVQLVLTALEPFIANLPEEQQNSVRLASARAIFILRAEASGADPASADAPIQALEAVMSKYSASPKA